MLNKTPNGRNDTYGGVFVYNREEQILEKYPLEIRNTGKARGAFFCETDQGSMLLKEFRGSKERVAFLESMLNFLNDQGFVVEAIVRTKEEQLLSSDDDNQTTFLLKTWYTGKECDVKNRENLILTVKKLAGFHNLVRCYEGDIPEFLMEKQEDLLEEYRRHNRELNKVKNYIRAKHKKNAFETLFMEKQEYFRKQGEEVANQLQQQLDKISEVQWMHMCGICHGDFNQHNVIFHGTEIIFLNFEKMSMDIQVIDLSNFMRKILEKYNWNPSLGIELITAYDQVRKLSWIELEQLYLRLAFPMKFWKIANHYYNSRKSWVSGRDIEKLQKVLEQEEARKQFLRMLFYFTGDCDKLEAY